MRKALVVGIDDYPSAPLHGCINDATSFASIIENNGDGSQILTLDCIQMFLLSQI